MSTSNQQKILELADQYESNVRLYSRKFPTIFLKSKGSYLYNIDAQVFLDFFTGAGALNYGHNHPFLKQAAIQYLEDDGILHSLDMYTENHIKFIINFHDIILEPRKLNYKIQFTGPTGANAVEAALKLARLYTKRKNIIYFKNAYHGLSLGALSVSDVKQKKGLPINLSHTIQFPYDNPLETESLLDQLRLYLNSLPKEDVPAAIILETVQGEGGINAASEKWLQGIEAIAHDFKILLIADEIQTGCGRVGSFFSFEQFNLNPDIVCLSKSLSGYGLPLSIILIKPEFDAWFPGEHTSTFRSNNLALACAVKALDFWQDETFLLKLKKNIVFLDQNLQYLKNKFPKFDLKLKGRGLMRGMEWSSAEIAQKISTGVFKRGLIAECAGPNDQVLKIMPPLTISFSEIKQGIDILENCFEEMLT